MPAKFRKTKKDRSLYNSSFFGLEIDGINEASFAKASGVASEIELHKYQEGGVNHFEHQIPTRTKFSNITLEKGMTKSKELSNWFQQIKEGIIAKKNFSVVLWNEKGEEIRRWNFVNGYPVKWSAGDLDALGNQVMIEKIELVHEGFTES